MGILFPILLLMTQDSLKTQFHIKSPAFSYGQMIPAKYTCDGKDISPEIVFEDVPKNAKSIALIADDPDAPMGTWVHWVIYNIPPDTVRLREGFPEKMRVGEICQGINDFKRYGYGGPCPPSGVHRYFFKAYVLDTILPCEKDMTKKKLLKWMNGHVIAQDTLMGRYKRHK